MLAADRTSQYVEPAALNNRAVAVGSALDTDRHEHPVRWSVTGVPTRLASLPGADPEAREPDAVDINDQGLVVGDDGSSIVAWSTPSTPRVVLAGTSDRPAMARAVDNRGVVAGIVAGHAALIDADGGVHRLGRLPGERYGVPGHGVDTVGVRPRPR